MPDEIPVPPKLTADDVLLSDEQKTFILSRYDSLDLSTLTRQTFKNDKLDARSKEGIAIKKYLINILKAKQNKDFKTKQVIKTEIAIERKVERENLPALNQEQKDFIINNASTMSPVEISTTLLGQAGTPTDKPVSDIREFIKKEMGEQFLINEKGKVTQEYEPPRYIPQIILKLNRYKIADLVENKISSQQKKCLEAVINYMQDLNFLMTIKSYLEEDDQNLFEFQFISLTWNKPDLSHSDKQAYMSVATDFVRLKEARKLINQLAFVVQEKINVDRDQRIQLSDALERMHSNASKNYNDVSERISKSLASLESTRAKRIENETQRNNSILVLVEAITIEENRRKFLEISKMEKLRVGEEINKIETADDLVGKIYGISKEELLA